MTAASNLALRTHISGVVFTSSNDNMAATAGGGQNVGARLNSGLNRFTVVVTAGDSAQLPSILAGEAEGHVVVINDDLTTSMNVFPATGETMNGAANASAAVAANSAAFFMLVKSVAGWRSATL
jgi:hypothetical protein